MDILHPTVDEVIELWCDALESGKYKQGTGKLCDKHKKYCCLGVLCEVYQENVGRLNKVFETDRYRYNETTSTLPDVVREWANLKSYGGTYLNRSLIEDNDKLGKNFKQIAQIIRNNKSLFFAQEKQD